MYNMSDLIFNIKRIRECFFVFVSTRPIVLAETPFFCRLRISVIKVAVAIRLLLDAAYVLEIMKITG